MSLRASTKAVTRATDAAAGRGNFVFQSWKYPNLQLIVAPDQPLTDGKVVDVTDARRPKTLHALSLRVDRPGKVSNFSSSASFTAVVIEAILNRTPSDQVVWSHFPPGLNLAAHLNIAVGEQSSAGGFHDYTAYKWVAERYTVQKDKTAAKKGNVQGSKKDKLQGQKRNRPTKGRRTSTAV
jgi:hypothetical protein